MEEKGVLMLALFALGPRLKNTCGFRVSENLLFNIIENKIPKEKLEEIKNILLKFEVFPPYLRLLAQTHQKDIFSPEVQEAYWLGNDLLKKCSSSRLKKEIKEHFLNLGLDFKRANTLTQLIPNGAKPHHSVSVLYSFYAPKDPYLSKIPLKRRENCLVLWGEILQIKENTLLVKTPTLNQKSGKWALEKTASKEVFWKIGKTKLLKTPQKGQFVAIHQDLAVWLLSPSQLQNLQKWTIYHCHLAHL